MEQNYSHLEREGLAYVFRVRKFHSNLFGHAFELITDHMPLLVLLNEDPLRFWLGSELSLFVFTYEYTLSFHPTEVHSNADTWSRLPLSSAAAEVLMPDTIVDHLAYSLVTVEQIRSWHKGSCSGMCPGLSPER